MAAESTKILRSSVHKFLKGYQFYTLFAAAIVFPVSVSILLSQPLLQSSTTFQTISSRIRSLSEAAGFPAASPFHSFLNLKLSETLTSQIFTLPFTLTLLMLAKSSIILSLLSDDPRCTPSNIYRRYRYLVATQLFNYFLILSVNASVFTLLFVAFNTVDVLGFSSVNSDIILSASGAALYCLVVATTFVTCNLASIVAAVERCSGFLAVLRACVLIKGRVATVLILAVPANLSLAALELLFAHRVIGPYRMRVDCAVVLEGILIAYMYSILLVVDIVVNCMLYKRSSRRSCWSSWEDGFGYGVELEPEEKGLVQV